MLVKVACGWIRTGFVVIGTEGFVRGDRPGNSGPDTDEVHEFKGVEVGHRHHSTGASGSIEKRLSLKKNLLCS